MNFKDELRVATEVEEVGAEESIPSELYVAVDPEALVRKPTELAPGGSRTPTEQAPWAFRATHLRWTIFTPAHPGRTPPSARARTCLGSNEGQIVRRPCGQVAFLTYGPAMNWTRFRKILPKNQELRPLGMHSFSRSA